ncbi:hypothetical protein [Enterovibrio coralii]|uniref:Uncharacterized protein n=1 Tax=Enterovibrio coralii TaxID=294935 RepID=A0A135I2T5_9GAMM|nr:hypothetical protein [Enterovibrio coralii]KXF79741.1 hypothetical protein ATN88_12530 [Enterovibrio coralii]
MANSTATDTTTSVTDPVALLREFFERPEMESRLTVIAKERITGWENWLQVELSCFLHQRVPSDKGQWWREYAIHWANKPRASNFAKPDFWLWSGTKGDYHLIELKQSKRADEKALEGVQGDIKKLSSLSKKFYVKGRKNEECYTCASKVFVLVSQWEPCEQKKLNGAKFTAKGAIGKSGWHWVLYLAN